MIRLLQRCLASLLACALVAAAPGQSAWAAAAARVKINLAQPNNAYRGSGYQGQKQSPNFTGQNFNLGLTPSLLKGDVPVPLPDMGGDVLGERSGSPLRAESDPLYKQLELPGFTPADQAARMGKILPFVPKTTTPESLDALSGAPVLPIIQDGAYSQPSSKIASALTLLKGLWGGKKTETVAGSNEGSKGKNVIPLFKGKDNDGSGSGKNPPPPPGGGDGNGGGNEGGGKSWFGLGKTAVLFIGALLVAQIGVEALGVAMPTLMQKTFGDFTAVAQLAIFSSIASIIGRQLGAVVVEKLGLRRTYLGATAIRLLSMTALVTLLATGHMTLPLMIGFYSVNGLLGGVAVTAEASIPPALVGKDQAKIERFWTIEQTALEVLGFLGPIAFGSIVGGFGFMPALIAFPVTFAAALAIMFFTLRIPQKIELARQADLKLKQEMRERGELIETPSLTAAAKIVPHLLLAAVGGFAFGWIGAAVGMSLALLVARWLRAANAERNPLKKLWDAPSLLAKTPARPGSIKAIFEQFFSRVSHGAKLVWRNPVLRTAFLAYTAIMVLNPFLYSMIGPGYGLLIAGKESAELATSIGGWLTGLYSLGGLLGGLLMMREQAKLKKLPEAEQNELLRKSMIKWIKWTTFSLAALFTLAFPLPMLGVLIPALPGWAGTLTLPALALIPYGIAQVISMVKLKSFFQSQVPNADKDMPSAMGFFGSASLAVSTLGLLGLKYLFKGFDGYTPFLVIAGMMVPLAIYYWYANRQLDKATKKSE